jgi:hypothetical protein
MFHLQCGPVDGTLYVILVVVLIMIRGLVRLILSNVIELFFDDQTNPIVFAGWIQKTCKRRRVVWIEVRCRYRDVFFNEELYRFYWRVRTYRVI